MIYVFNETEKSAWAVKSKNDYFYQISGGKIGIDLSKTGLDNGPLEDVFHTDLLTGYGCKPLLDKPGAITLGCVCDKKTLIVFDKRNLNPFIHSIGEKVRYNNNLFLCAFDMTYQAVYSVNAYNGNIYSYDYDSENKVLYVIFSLKEGTDHTLRVVGKTDRGSIYRKRIILSKTDPDKYVMNYNVWPDEDSIPCNSKGEKIIDLRDNRSNDLTNIRIKVYRPKRPCANVAVLSETIDSCKAIIDKRYHIDPKHSNFFTVDEKKGGLKGLISFLRKRKLDTVTIFSTDYTLADVKPKSKEIRDNFLNDKGFKSFKTVQLMMKDGSIVYLK